MRIDAELLRLIRDQGLAGGFLFGWADEWFKFTWNTIEHQDGERRQLWHDPLTNEQHFGLLAMDAAGPPDAASQRTCSTPSGGWPVRRATARVDESYVHLRIGLGDSPPSALTLGFDVLPGLVGNAPPGALDRMADAAFALEPGRTGPGRPTCGTSSIRCRWTTGAGRGARAGAGRLEAVRAGGEPGADRAEHRRAAAGRDPSTWARCATAAGIRPTRTRTAGRCGGATATT